MLKKLSCILCILLMCLNILGCNSTKINKADTIKNRIENAKPEAVKEEPEAFKRALQEVEKTVDNKQKAVRQKNLNEYMRTVNSEDKEYYAEQRHWFQDILINDIKDYKLQILNVEKNDDDSYLVDLSQSYTFKERKSSLKYTAVFKKNGTVMVDCGLNFKQRETEHFIIKYMEKSEDLADCFSRAAEEGYDMALERYGKVPEDKTEIKIYDDMETLRQFVKLSFQWDMAGWYEYSESIKFIGLKDEVKSQGLAHELIHKITINETNNNMPYWLAEGIATHYTEKEISVGSQKNRYNIEELQSLDLETLTDNTAVLNYYKSSQAMVEYIIRNYGEAALKDILKELSKYPFEDLTGREVNMKNTELFDKTAKKVLGRGTAELDKEYNFSETK